MNHAWVVVLFATSPCLFSCTNNRLAAGPDFQKHLQKALIEAKPGSVIVLPPGRHAIDNTLSLTVPGVTLRGAGAAQTILSYQSQKAGAAGLLVTANDFTIEDLAIEDTKGDGLKINGAQGVHIRHLRVEWTGGPKEENGAYGIYPVQCQKVLIEDSVVRGASDAGIYVGQSSQIVVQRNRVDQNVAGIEIENSSFADVHDNKASGNTAGILVFNLPDLPVQGGHQVRIFANEVQENNLANFAPKGNLVAGVPAGTGVMVMSASEIEVFANTIKDHATSNVTIVSYLVTRNPIKDPKYYPYPEGVYVHGNQIKNGGYRPSGRLAGAFAAATGKSMADVNYDGFKNEAAVADLSLVEKRKICIQDNGAATFTNLDAANKIRSPSTDLSPHNCKLPALQAVQVN